MGTLFDSNNKGNQPATVLSFAKLWLHFIDIDCILVPFSQVSAKFTYCSALLQTIQS